jgi:hypothetical protein
MKLLEQVYNKSEEPINYPAGNLSAHFKRYTHNIKDIKK